MRKPNPGDFDWSPAVIERLTELWLDGITGLEIAQRLGVSRSSVLGKLRRLGLLCRFRPQRPIMARRTPATPVPKPTPRKVPNKRNTRPLPPPEPYQAPPPPPLPAYGTLNLLDLRHNSCRWPEGAGPIFVFCGRPQASQSSYCPEHARLSLSHGSQRDFDRMAAQALGGKLFASRAGVEQ